MKTIWDKNKIRLARIDAKMTPLDSARSLKITVEYLYMVENGKKRPSETLVDRFALLYQKSVSYFLKSEKFLPQT